MVVENTVRGAHHCLPITADVPSQSETRREVVLVAWESLLNVQAVLQSQQISLGQGDAGQWIFESNRRDCVSQFHVVAHTVIEGEIVTCLPGVLREQSNRAVLDRAAWISEALNKYAGEPETVRLDRLKRRRAGGQASDYRLQSKAAEVE